VYVHECSISPMLLLSSFYQVVMQVGHEKALSQPIQTIIRNTILSHTLELLIKLVDGHYSKMSHFGFSPPNTLVTLVKAEA